MGSLNRVRSAGLVAGMVLAATVAGGPAGGAEKVDAAQAVTKNVTQGALRIVRPDGAIVECPLKHTDVKASVSGFIARVKVTQTFHNPMKEKIEAVYVFPLPHKAAVDDMTMVIGERRIVGMIKRRDAARYIYEQALARGQTAALLEQERPNIFTQSVGNIAPGQDIQIEISYLDVLEYDMGVYEFHFPMVVGPRFIPGKETSGMPPVPPELRGKVGETEAAKVQPGEGQPGGTGWAPDTDRVPDASRITPPVLKPGFRTGHDISLAIQLDAGVPIQDLKATNHKAHVEKTGPTSAVAKLHPADAIPNKDFVLKYAVVGKKPAMAVLSHTDKRGRGYFMLMIQPAEDERLKQSPPREICFLIDVSGSMSGAPTALVRRTMAQFLKRCKTTDTVQVITFASRANKLFEKSVPANKENIEKALGFTRGIRGGGGTHMLKGIKMAINEPLDPERVRIVVMLTDGYIGNESEIIAEVGRRCGDQIRFWCVGIGSSPNRHLVDGVARQGGGMAKVLGLNDDPVPMVQQAMHRIHRAQLAKIRIDWGTLAVSETYPARIPELWAGRPVVLYGRYEGGGRSGITVNGKIEGKPASWPLTVELPATSSEHEVLSKVWARQKIEDLMHQTYYQGSPAVEEEVTALALTYRLMSQYTSFVAVDESQAPTVEPARPPRRMLVPVPIPAGTRYEGFFGPPPVLAMNDMKADHSGRAMWLSTGSSGGGKLSAMGGPSGPPPPGTPWGMTVAPVRTPMAGPVSRMSRGRARAGRPGLARDALKPHLRKAGEGFVGGLSLDACEEEGQFRYNVDARYIYGRTDVSKVSTQIQKALKQVLADAEKVREGGAARKAVGMYAYAYLLDGALIGLRQSNGESSDKALAALKAIRAKQVPLWAKTMPGLRKRLDLVIRDKSLAEAVQMVAAAAGQPVHLDPKGVADASRMLGRQELRVTWLDLRGATMAQALDWILLPVRMTWWPGNASIMVSTARRTGEMTPWVYDVSHMVMPAKEDLDKAKGYDERLKLLSEPAQAFLAGVRTALTLSDEAALYVAPGQLLVFGNAKTHSAAGALFAAMADPKATVAEALAGLHKATSARAEQHTDAVAKEQAYRDQVRVAMAMRTYGWRLLAAAAGGELDLEALTQLQVAWKQPAAAQVLAGDASLIALRSAWAIDESAGALPKAAELQALAAKVRDLSHQAAEAALTRLSKSPKNATYQVEVLFAALASRDDAAFVKRAMVALSAEGVPAPVRTIAAALLGPKDKIDATALTGLLRSGVRGDSMTVLLAMACRRAGGGTWAAFRAESRELLGRQPLDGSVVILINRLSRTPLPVVAGR